MTVKTTLEDLVIAYRKAKVDSYFENGQLTALNFATFEEDLLGNLERIKSILDSDPNLKSISTGHYAFIIKSLELKAQKDKPLAFYSDSRRHWETEEIEEITFRIIGQHSIDFHVISSLWINKVGHKLEALVGENSYGCRLKRGKKKSTQLVENSSSPDKFELGHFRPYITDYKRWQSNGIAKIQEALGNGKKIVAVTADIKKFYHRIDPSFLLSQRFIEYSSIQYTREERNLTASFVRLLQTWSTQVALDPIIPPELKYNNHSGVPVGLAASKVIANVLLLFLDEEIEKELQPIYYGRYVDDLFLVLEDNGKITSSESFWNFVSKRIGSIDRSFDPLNEERGPAIKIPYAQNSLIRFGTGKEKLFILEGSSGEAFITTLKESLDENSSEWRMLPDSEADLETLAQDMAKASSDSEETVNGLRKSDGVSIQRLKFALQLRNFEAVVGLLPREIWTSGLDKFFGLTVDYVLAPDKIATYTKYHPRLIKLAILSENFSVAKDLYLQINESWDLVSNKLSSPSQKEILSRAREYNNQLLWEAICASLPNDFSNWNDWSEVLLYSSFSNEEIRVIRRKLFYADLHTIPFKRVLLDSNKELVRHLSTKRKKFMLNEELVMDLFDLDKARELITVLVDGHSKKTDLDHIFVPNALFFVTRPITVLELTMVIPQWPLNEKRGQFDSFLELLKLRSVYVTSDQIGEFELGQSDELIKIEFGKVSKIQNPTFALTSFETDEKSWAAWLRGDLSEPDKIRYTRLFQLLNDVLKCKRKIDYLVFPELSLPRRVLVYVAAKLRTKRISLIAGIEYEMRPKPITLHSSILGIVSNQLIYILCTESHGFIEQLSIIQEKTDAAIHEEQELFNTAGQILVPKNEIKYLIKHDGILMSGLICNDLLNIDYRKALRGLIDALVVVEWNKDTETYDSIVKSASNDLHCFVLQVNNRKYGDTRLRGPYKESYDRDKVRVRGGELDYYVVTTLEVDKLREFQRFHRSPDKPFKPVPTGYAMSDERRNDS